MTWIGGAAWTGTASARAAPSSPPMIRNLMTCILYLQIETFSKERLDEPVGLLAVAKPPLIRIPHQLSWNAQRDGAQREPFDVLRCYCELRRPESVAVAAARASRIRISGAGQYRSWGLT